MSARRIVAATVAISFAVGLLPSAALGDGEFNKASYWPTADELRRELQDIGREFRLNVGRIVQPFGGSVPASLHEPDMYWQSGDLYLSATTGPLVVALKQQFTLLDAGYSDGGFNYTNAMEVASRLPLPPDTMQRVIRYVDGYDSLRQLAEAEPCVRFDFTGGVVVVATPARPSNSSPSRMHLAPTGALDYPVAYPEYSAPLYVDDCTSIPLDSPALGPPAPMPSPSPNPDDAPNPEDAPKAFSGVGPSWTDRFFLRSGSYTMRFAGSSCDDWHVALFHSAIDYDKDTPATAGMVNTPEARTGEVNAATYYLSVGSGIPDEPEDFSACRWTVTIEPSLPG